MEAKLTTTYHGSTQQCVRYQAPLERLISAGLVTVAMQESIKRRRQKGVGTTAIGDGFHLCSGLDAESKPGCWDLAIFTRAFPDEPRRIGTSMAKRALKRIAKAARVDGEARHG